MVAAERVDGLGKRFLPWPLRRFSECVGAGVEWSDTKSLLRLYVSGGCLDGLTWKSLDLIDAVGCS